MKKILFLLFCTIVTLSLKAQKITSNIGTVADGYNFWLYTPDPVGEEVQKKPVVIFLHGASLCGNDLNRVRRYGTIDAIEKGRELDAYVIAPQNPGGRWQPEKIMNILEYVSSKHNVDQDRIYVLGMSLGGYGTIDFAATYPDRVAAAMALCGGASVRDVAGLNDVPLWIVHGIADERVSVRESDKVVDKMRDDNKVTPRLIYNRIPGMNHSRPCRLFYLKESYDWLFAHNLRDKDRTVNLNYTFDVASSVKDAYKDLNRSTRRQLIAPGDSYQNLAYGNGSRSSKSSKSAVKKSKRNKGTAVSTRRSAKSGHATRVSSKARARRR